MSLAVKRAGAYSLIVDEGRPHHRRWGLPESGPADRHSYRLANALVGNPLPLASLEISFSGPELVALEDTGFACVGADFSIWKEGVLLLFQCSGTLKKGETLEIGGSKTGARCYLAVVGGFEVPRILESQSAFQPITKESLLECAESLCDFRWLAETPIRNIIQPLRVVAGPQVQYFDIQKIVSQTYTVSPLGNRMGVRLLGEPIPVPEVQLVSEPVTTGAIQVTADGQLVILGVEGQTIGGYHKPLHVISAEWDRIGQLRPNQRIRFELVTLEDAERLRVEYEGECRRVERVVRLMTSG